MRRIKEEEVVLRQLRVSWRPGWNILNFSMNAGIRWRVSYEIWLSEGSEKYWNKYEQRCKNEILTTLRALAGFLISFLLLSQSRRMSFPTNINAREIHWLNENKNPNEDQKEPLNATSMTTPGFRLFALMKSQLRIRMRSIGARRCAERKTTEPIELLER